MESTAVVFRMDREGVVFALFPELPADNQGVLLQLLSARRPALCRRLLRLHRAQPSGNPDRLRRSSCRTDAAGLPLGSSAACYECHAQPAAAACEGRLMS